MKNTALASFIIWGLALAYKAFDTPDFKAVFGVLASTAVINPNNLFSVRGPKIMGIGQDS